jgi:hypothetical protein
MNRLFVRTIAALLMFAAAQALPAGRQIPAPRTSHPGNIFVTGEAVALEAGPGPGPWQLFDYEGRLVAEPKTVDGRVQIGKLPVGYYELKSGAASQPLSLGVVERLRAPTPANSPVAVDVAMAWFYPPARMADVASLCTLAGVNYVRDRLSWGEVESARGQFVSNTRYDASAKAQSAAGLKALQVHHHSPAWANSNGKRFPLDLRDAYNFQRELARRWKGQVLAFEPWNEADISVFGGHTGSEMASLQKAAFLGIKAGNPDTIACLNVFASHRESTLNDLHDNMAWPYFDTFNLHHYERFDAYPKIYSDFRAISAGKPLWVTECSVPVKWQGDERLKEPSPEDLRIQSERLPMVFAHSLNERPEAVFYFLLPHYVEGQTQFGIIRSNLTPRPAFLALAAAGRLLAGARPLGRMEDCDASARAFLFHAEPDGKPARVLVAWSEKETDLVLPHVPIACFDHLGRASRTTGATLKIGRAPVYAILPFSARLKVAEPPSRPPLLPGSPCPIVLQGLASEGAVDLEKSAYKVEPGKVTEIPVYVYNFSEKTQAGTLRVSVYPGDWQVLLPSDVQLAPGERKQLSLGIQPGRTVGGEPAKVRLVGDFAGTGRPVLSLRFITTGKN